ncbi:MAG: DUF4125 family protein, partial [Eubacterium sp.]
RSALELLKEADEVLSGRSPSDFHYSAVLAGFGDAYYKAGKYEAASDFYERALSEIELHMGQNNFYTIVSDNLAQTYKSIGKERPVLSGLELSRRFYEAFGKPVLSKQFKHVINSIAVGLAGEGSECLGFDDDLSHDHDFGPGFCIWVPDDMPEDTVISLRKAYDALPKSFFGIKRVSTKEASGRVGVCRVSEFFHRLIGTDDIPNTEQQWLNVDESMLAAVCSGEIFMDKSGLMTERRKKLLSGYPETVRLRRLAQQLGRMAQCGQYNYSRMRRRGDFATAQIYMTQFCQHAMQAAHLCCGKYAPYEKWLLRSTMSLSGFSDYAELIRKLLLMTPSESDSFDENSDNTCILIQNICEIIAQEVAMKDDVEYTADMYLADMAEQLAAKAQHAEQHNLHVDQIIHLEWNAFDKVHNIGGRASCQDDWETFSIMRRSQYIQWPDKLLTDWISEFESATASGRNLITEKYARMMESTDPQRYSELKASLPDISEDFVKLREAIISIQISWMDDFASGYPNLAS